MRAVLVIAFATGCTTLGSMPTTTGISAVPAGRTGVELQAGLIPVYRLSSAASGDNRHGASTQQLSGLIDPDTLLGVPGLFVAGRVGGGKKADTTVEPMLGYRRSMGDLSIAGIAFGTRARGSEKMASYEAIRAGGELVVDALLVAIGGWGEIHVQGALSGTYVSATGTYCVDDAGVGIDCADDGSSRSVDGELAGLYSAATFTMALDILRRRPQPFHGVRIGLMFAAGHMPHLVDGNQRKGDVYLTGGLSVTVGLGASQ